MNIKMNCNNLLIIQEEYLDQALDNEAMAAVAKHLMNCGKCTARIHSLQVLHNSMSLLSQSNPSEFDEKFFRRLITNVSQSTSSFDRKWRWLSGSIGGAIAASLAVWFFITPPTISTNPAKADVYNVTLAVNKIEVIRLAFNAPNNMQKVLVSLELPKHMELAGYPGQLIFEWHTDLLKGENVLSLPLIATRAEQGILVARIGLGNKHKIFRITTTAKLDPLGQGIWSGAKKQLG